MSSRKEQRKSKKRALRQRDEALAAARDGNLPLAGRLIERALAAGPGNARTWLAKARVERLRGELRAAEVSLRTALELSPGYADVQSELDALLADRGALHTPEPALVIEVGSAPDCTRTASADWSALFAELGARGVAALRGLLTTDERRELASAAPSWTLGPPVPLAPPPFAHELARELWFQVAPLASALATELGRASWPRYIEGLAARGGGGPAFALAHAAPPSGAPLPPPRTSERFPLAAAVALEQRCELHLVDLRPGRRRHAHALTLEPGDGALFFRSARPLRVAGALGLQPVQAELVTPAGAAGAEDGPALLLVLDGEA